MMVVYMMRVYIGTYCDSVDVLGDTLINKAQGIYSVMVGSPVAPLGQGAELTAPYLIPRKKSGTKSE